MNGQVVPVSGRAAWPSERGEKRVSIEKGSNHRDIIAHSRVISCVARTPAFAPPPSSLPLTSAVADIGYRCIYLRNTARQPFLPSAPHPLQCGPSLRTLVAVGVRGYRTGSSSLRGEPPSWWRVWQHPFLTTWISRLAVKSS